MLPKFTLFGPLHWVIFATTILIPIFLNILVRKFPFLKYKINWMIAILLVGNECLTLYLRHRCHVPLRNVLPMHLCDWTIIVTILALLKPHQLLYEISYYWALAGSLPAVMTPVFSHPYIYAFFISHCVPVVAVLYLTIGFHMRPSKFSIWKVYGVLQIYVVTAVFFNWILKTNYGLLCPEYSNSNLFIHLGYWLRYVLPMEIVALVFFILLYTPFYFYDKIIKFGIKEKTGLVF